MQERKKEMKRTSMRILLAVLMMTFILSSFSFGTSAAENSAKPQTRGFYNLLDTVNFDTVEPDDKNGNGIVDSTEGTEDEAADTVDNRKFIYDNYGFYFGNKNQAVLRQYGDDGRVAITAPAYIHADQNNGMEELFFSSTDGPKHFTWEMDIAVTKDFGGTGDQNNKLNYPTTRHRGMSLLSYRYSYQKDGATQYADSWFLKVTAPGVGKIAFNEDGTKANSVAAVAEGKENVGYFYATGQDISYDFTADSKIGWASGGYSYTEPDLESPIYVQDTDEETGEPKVDENGNPVYVQATDEETGAPKVDENGNPVYVQATDEDGNLLYNTKKITPADGTYLDGRVTAAISNAAIDNACTYTLGEEVHITLDFKRYKTIMYVEIYVDDKLCGTYNYNLGAGTGFKITDLVGGDCVSVDDMKITVLDCGGDHDSLWNADYQLTPVANNGVVAKNVCRLCGAVENEEYPNLILEDTSFTSFGNGAQYSKLWKTGEGATNYHELLMGTTTQAADDWWLNFDITYTSVVPSSYATDARRSWITWMVKDKSYSQLLNIHRYDDTKSYVTMYGEAKGVWTLYLVENQKYSFHINLDPATGCYKVYVTDYTNGIYNQYFGSVTNGIFKNTVAAVQNGTYPAVRFGDAGTGVSNVSGITYTRNMPMDTHTHTSVEFGAEEELYIDGSSIKYTDYTCYCGYSAGTQEIKSLVVDKIENLKKGTKTLSYTAPTGEYWVTTDMNLKTLTKDGNLLAIGDTALLKLEGGKLVSGEYSATAEQKAYAVGVKLNGNAYTLYIDGENVATGEYAGSSAVTYGAADLDASFNYNKIAILEVLGEGVAPAVPTVGSSITNVPCAHSAKKATAVADYSGDRTSFVYVCEKCGDRVYETPDQDIPLYSDGKHTTAWSNPASATVSANQMKHFYFDAEDAGSSSLPYWIDFDFNYEANFVNNTAGASYVHNGNGRNLMNFGTNYNGFLRTHPVVKGYNVKLENGKETVTTIYYAEYMSIEMFNTDVVLAEVVSGETVHFSIYVNTETRDLEIYVNGEHKYTWTDYLDYSGTWNGNYIRINDGTQLNFSMKNLRFTRAHEHTTDYAADITVNSADTWLGHSDADCYCGAKVFKENSISENLAGALSARIEGNGTVTLPADRDYWFATDIHIAKLSDTNLLTLGTEALLSLNGGKLVDKNGEEIADVEANTTVQIAYNMLHFNENTIRLYVNGVEVGAYVVNGDTSLTLGADGLADINFLYTKVAELGDYFTPVAPAYSDSYVSTCIHTPTDDGYQFITVPGKTYSSGMRGVNKLIYSYICSACGERVYEMQGETLNVNATHKAATSVKKALGKATLTSPADFDIYGDRLTAVEGAKFIPVDVASIGLGAEPYWISFELSGTVSPDQVFAVAASGKGSGGSFFALFAEDINVYVQMMRAYGVLLSDEDKAAVDAGTFNDYVKVTYKEVDYYYYNNRVGIRPYQGDRPTSKTEEDFVITFKSGDVHNVAIYVEPNIAKSEYVYTIYVDGVKMSVQTSTGKAHFDQLLGNYSIRLTDGNYGSFYFNNLSLVKAAQHGMTSHDVALEEGMTFGEQVSVFELTASLNNLSNENAYYPLVSLNRDHVKLSPLFVNASTGELAYKTNGNQYVSLEHTLTNEPMQIVIVFDEMTSTFRYHFDTAVVEDVSAYHHYFNISDGAKVENGGYNGFGVNVTLNDAYNIGSSDTAEVWGFQYKELSGDIRIISGLNGRYYDEVGGYVQLYKNGALVKDAKASEDTVYSGFVNNDHDVSAGDLGFKYVSILPIKWDGEVKFEAGTNYYIIYRPYVVLCGVEYLGEPVKINVTYDGSEAPVYAFDDNYSLNSVTDNAANITYTGHYYKDNANNTIAGTKTMPFVSTEELDLVVRDGYFYGGGAYYEFSVNPESANAAFIVIDSGANATFNLYLNGSETAVEYDVVNGRNYLPVENLVAGEVNSIKIERKVGYREYPLVFKGMVLEGDIVAPVAAE